MNKKAFTITTSVLMILMATIGYVFFAIRYRADTVSNYEIMIMGANAFEMALLAVLYILNRLSEDTISRSGKYFGLVIIIMCIKIFVDQFSYTIDGNVELIWLNWIVCSLTYMCTAPIMVFFWNYCGHQLGINGKEFDIINWIVIGLGAITCILFLINPFTHMILYIDADGWFHLADNYWVILVQNTFCNLACAIEVLRSHVKIQKKLMVAFVFLAPIIGNLLSTISTDMMFTCYLLMTLGIFFCYVDVFIRGEDEYMAKMKELDMATAIQRGALRADFGNFGDHKIYAYMKPAREVGGDFYDFFTVDDHTLGVLIADVSGKGIPAAMFMMQGLCAIRELARSKLPINEVFEKANNLLCEHNDNEFFITAWMGYIDRKTGEVQYVNAGHNPPIIKRADGSAEYLVSKSGLVLAAMEDMPYRVFRLVMNQGDTLFMYTDGITEAQTMENELYGEDRLLSLARNAELDPEELTITILNGVNSFVGRAEQFDDMTIISYERE